MRPELEDALRETCQIAQARRESRARRREALKDLRRALAEGSREDVQRAADRVLAEEGNEPEASDCACPRLHGGAG